MALALGHHAEVYSSIAELVRHAPREGIIVARDDILPGGTAEIIDLLSASGVWLPLIIAADDADIPRIVEAIRGGATDYIQLPLEEAQLAAMLDRTINRARDDSRARRSLIEARAKIGTLSEREREVLSLLVEGSSNKLIARELDISPRTVEIHRANMMEKLGARHVAQAVRLLLQAQLALGGA